MGFITKEKPGEALSRAGKSQGKTERIRKRGKYLSFRANKAKQSEIIKAVKSGDGQRGELNEFRKKEVKVQRTKSKKQNTDGRGERRTRSK